MAFHGENVPVPDWAALAEDLGLTKPTEGGRIEYGGGATARRAICELLGQDVLASAFNAYMDGEVGSGLARSVLALLKPEGLAEACLELFVGDDGGVRAFSALSLLVELADGCEWDWIPRLLETKSANARGAALHLMAIAISAGRFESGEVQALLKELRGQAGDEVSEQIREVEERLTVMEDLFGGAGGERAN